MVQRRFQCVICGIEFVVGFLLYVYVLHHLAGNVLPVAHLLYEVLVFLVQSLDTFFFLCRSLAVFQLLLTEFLYFFLEVVGYLYLLLHSILIGINLPSQLCIVLCRTVYGVGLLTESCHVFHLGITQLVEAVNQGLHGGYEFIQCTFGFGAYQVTL